MQSQKMMQSIQRIQRMYSRGCKLKDVEAEENAYGEADAEDAELETPSGDKPAQGFIR
jgi:hypothetical protein